LQADVLLGPAAVRQGSDPSAASVKQQQQQQCSGAMTEATAITGRSNQHWQQQQQRGADCFAGATASNTEQLLLLQQLVQHMLQQQCLQPLQALPHNSNSNHPAVGEGSMDEQQASHLRQLLAKVDQDLDYVGAEGSAAAGAAAAVDAGTDIVLVSVIGMHQKKLSSLRGDGQWGDGFGLCWPDSAAAALHMPGGKFKATCCSHQAAAGFTQTSRGHHNNTPASF
jgi:hypothetical protein